MASDGTLGTFPYWRVLVDLRSNCLWLCPGTIQLPAQQYTDWQSGSGGTYRDQTCRRSYLAGLHGVCWSIGDGTRRHFLSRV